MKYIITGQLPSGARFAWATCSKGFALVMFKGEVVRGASGWDTEADAQEFMDAMLKQNPRMDAELGPFQIERVELPS